jgi:3-deoxy-D-manno-octulosonate 8-phosphate phosphatase KdsC-like HAD superfamily phosphatase
MTVSKVFFKSLKPMTGYYDKNLTKKAAEIEAGEELQLLQCKLVEGDANAFKYMGKVALYVSAQDAEQFVFSKIEEEEI